MMKVLKITKFNPNSSVPRFYLPELDGLRFFAFLLVFIHHTQLFSEIPYLSFLKTYGWIGVDLFFSLSGFLFTKLLIDEFEKTKTINFKKFYLRRIFRIWPIYFLFVGFSVSVYLLIGGKIDHYIALRIIGLLTFSDNLMAAFHGFDPVTFTGHLWTISYEEQFYVVIPLLIFLLVRSGSKIRLIMLISSFIILNAIRFVFISGNFSFPAIWVLPITHFESIILGIVIGFGGFDSLLKNVKPLLIGLFGILLFFSLYFIPEFDNTTYWLILGYLIVGISTSLLLFAVLKSSFLKRILSKKIFVFFGKRSYGLYVYHLFGNAVITYFTEYIQILPSNALVSFVCSLLFTGTIAIVSYKFIEIPFLQLKQKFEVIRSRPI